MFLLQTGRARISLMRFTFLDNASRWPFSFPNAVLYQVRPEIFWCVPPKRSIPILPIFRRTEFIGSESWDTLPWTFFSFRMASLSNFFSRPPAGFLLTIQHVDTGNESHKCICFQTCNHDIRDEANNYTTIFYILPLVAGLASRLVEPLSSVRPFPVCTEEDSCSR